MRGPLLYLSYLLPSLGQKRQTEDHGWISGPENPSKGVILVQSIREGSRMRVHQYGASVTKPDIFPKQRAASIPGEDPGDPTEGSTELHYVFPPEGTH